MAKLITIIIIIFSFCAFALDGEWYKNLRVGSSSALPSSAVFQVDNTTKGSIPSPKMSTSNKNAITSPIEGLSVWDSTLHKRFDYTNSTWAAAVYEDITATITNKTLSGDNNTFQNLSITSIKTTANNNVFLQRDASGYVIDSSYGPSNISDKVIGESSSIDSEIVLFSGTTGKLVKRATGTGFAKISAGVLSATSSIDASSEINGILPVQYGGTGTVSLTANNVILGNGTTAVGFVSPGASGNLLTSNGTTWVSSTPAPSGGGGGTLIWTFPTLSPIKVNTDGFALLKFTDGVSQEMYAVYKVPSTYTAGTQIKLKGAQFFCNEGSNNVLVKTQSTLMTINSSILGTYTNQRTSTNSAVTLAVANRLMNVGDIDLTDGSGQINSVSVGANDSILIRFYRDTDTSTCDLLIFENSMFVQ